MSPNSMNESECIIFYYRQEIKELNILSYHWEKTEN